MQDPGKIAFFNQSDVSVKPFVDTFRIGINQFDERMVFLAFFQNSPRRFFIGHHDMP